MDPESKKLLEDTFKLTQENNQILHKVRRVQKRTTLFGLLHWLFIIGVAVGAFYFLQPYVDEVQQFFKDTGVTINKFQSFLPK